MQFRHMLGRNICSATVALCLLQASTLFAQTTSWTVCDVSIGGAPIALTTGDFNRDGNPDLAVVDQSNSQVVIILTDSQAFRALNCTGALTMADVNVGLSPNGIAAGDLDGNLTLDLAVSTLAGISILRGDNNGMFTADSPISGGASPQSVAIADVNVDNQADIVVGNGGEGTGVTILFGPTFSLGATPTLPTDEPISFLLAQDLNQDIAPDIAAGSGVNGEVVIFLNDFPSLPTTFSPVQILEAGTAPTAITAADFSRDAVPDLAIVGGTTQNGELRMFRNNLPNVSPAFTLRQTIMNIGSLPSSTAAGNLNSDAVPDLVVTNQGDATAPFFFGSGDGTVLQGPVNCSIGGTVCETDAMPRAVALADIDADGRPDVITANQGSVFNGGSLTFILSSAPNTPTATNTPLDTPMNTATPTPTETPTPTATPTQTDTPTNTPVISDCFIPRATPGCSNGTCESCVCALDSFCCDQAWDLTCVQDATGDCQVQCGFVPTSTPTITPTSSRTRTPTATNSPTNTPVDTPTFLPRTRTSTPTVTPTGPSPTPSTTLSPTAVPTETVSPTVTPTETLTPTRQPTSTPRCFGPGMSQICTSGDTCALQPNEGRSLHALLLLLPVLIGLAVRRRR